MSNKQCNQLPQKNQKKNKAQNQQKKGNNKDQKDDKQIRDKNKQTNKSQFFEQMNEIGNPLVRVIKKKQRRPKQTK